MRERLAARNGLNAKKVLKVRASGTETQAKIFISKKKI